MSGTSMPWAGRRLPTFDTSLRPFRRSVVPDLCPVILEVLPHGEELRSHPGRLGSAMLDRRQGVKQSHRLTPWWWSGIPFGQASGMAPAPTMIPPAGREIASSWEPARPARTRACRRDHHTASAAHRRP
jgi:hypothetical protein